MRNAASLHGRYRLLSVNRRSAAWLISIDAAVRNAMPYTLAEVAKATGTNKTTILRAIKSGKVSGTKDEHGTWLVEPAERHRVYSPVELRSDVGNDATQRYAPLAAPAIEAQIVALRDAAELLRTQLDDVRKDRDHWRDQAQAVTRQLALAAPVTMPALAPALWPWWRRIAG